MQVLFKTTLQYRHLRTFRCAWFPNIHEYDKSLAVTRKNVYSLVIAISIKGKGALVPLEKLTFLATLPLMNMTSRIYPSFLHTNIHLLSLISHILSTLLLWCHLILLQLGLRHVTLPISSHNIHKSLPPQYMNPLLLLVWFHMSLPLLLQKLTLKFSFLLHHMLLGQTLAPSNLEHFIQMQYLMNNDHKTESPQK